MSSSAPAAEVLEPVPEPAAGAPAPIAPSPGPAPPEPASKPKKKESPPPVLEEESAGPPPEEGAPAWVMTFGDLMSLLLTFFILLFSMSSIEVEKFKAVAASFREALGEEGTGVISEVPPPMTQEPAKPEEVYVDSGAGQVSAAMSDIANVLQQFVQENDLSEQVDVSQDDAGVYLRIQDMALFRPGSSDIEAASVEIVQRLGLILQAIQVPLVVSGHTDDIPIRSPIFHSNWELSAARAAGVARLLVETGHEPQSMTVEAYGEYRPIGDNASPEGRAQNRRVELYYSRQSIEDTMRDRGLLPDESAGADTPPAQGGDVPAATPAEPGTPGA
ncbi:MAG: flagellar motor protein MotB [Gemmatimonadota bacterium]